jgi:hypothetical protein
MLAVAAGGGGGILAARWMGSAAPAAGGGRPGRIPTQLVNAAGPNAGGFPTRTSQVALYLTSGQCRVVSDAALLYPR